MHLFIVLLRIALGAIFAVAGITKLLDRRGTGEAVKNFGSPERLAPVLSFVLPIAELAIAAGLLFARTTRISALASLLMLSLFIVVISVNLARGRTHDCHCFGQLHTRAQPHLCAWRRLCALADTGATGFEYLQRACAAQLVPVAAVDRCSRSC